MAKKEEISKKNIEENNAALAEQLSLVGALNDKMSFLYKNSKDKYTTDKLSVDLTKQAVALTQNLASEYSSLKDVSKDLAKNEKLQNQARRQQLQIEKEIGEEGKKRLQFIANQEKGLNKSKEILKELRDQETLGIKGAKESADKLSKQLMTRQKSLSTQKANLSSEERQYMLLKDTSKVLSENQIYLEEQQKRQENINKGMGTFGRTITGVSGALSKMGLGEVGKNLGLEAASKKAQELSYELTDGGKKALGTFGKMRVGVAAFGAALKSALGPIAIISMIKNAYEKGEEAAKRLSEENVQVARTLGVAQGKANELAGEARAVGGAMGITGGAATQSMTQIYSSLKGTEKLSQSTLNTFMRLNVFAGMSAENLADIHRLSKLTGEDAGKVADAMARTAQETIRTQKVNVSTKEVMEGVGKISNVIKLNMGGSAEGLTKAFIQSKKLGMELNNIRGIADSLLNIEDSIAAEMEAELLTGQELNLEEARKKALAGDLVGVLEEVNKQGIDAARFEKMNTLQKEATAKALGMNVDQMADMLVGQKEAVSENQQLLDSQKQGVAAMQSSASVTERLAAAEEARANQFAKIFALIQPIVEAFKDLGPLVLEFITPIVEHLAPIITKLAETLLPIIKDIFKSLRPVIDAIFTALDPILEVVVDMAKQFLPIIASIFIQLGPIIAGLIKSISPIVLMLANAAKDLLPLIADAFKSMVPILIKLVAMFADVAKQLLPVIVELIQMLLPIVMDIIKAFMPLVTEILNLILPILKPILEVIIELTKILVPILVQAFQSLMPILQPVLELFMGVAKIIGGILKGDFSAVANGLKNIANGLINLVLGVFSYMLNTPVRAINAMLDFVPGFGGNTIPLVEFPKVKLAEGGIVTKPTNALIGEAGPEAVVPLNSNKSMNINTQALEAKIDRLIAAVERGGVVTLDGQKVGQALALGNFKQQ
jgi:hypothetical protein